MGQLCCFPFSQAEEKISKCGRRRSEPDEAELLRGNRKLVEDAVSRALQQYKQETFQNGGGPNSTALQLPSDEEDTATKTPANSATENRK
uniref:A kinase (PRKA) anchor protein 7 n=1 Tax=Cynoglossus semilaevis TaxID=244447 RepID=A0A3P8WU24_CYNSE